MPSAIRRAFHTVDLTGDDPSPQPWEPVPDLDGVADVADAGLVLLPDRERELRDRGLVHRGCAVAGDLEWPHRPLQVGVDRLAGVQGRPLGRELELVDLGLHRHRVPSAGNRQHLLRREVRGGCHTSTQALATDSQSPKSPYYTGIWKLFG